MWIFLLVSNTRRSQSPIATIPYSTQRVDTRVCPCREGTHKGHPYAPHSTKALRSNAYQNYSLIGALANAPYTKFYPLPTTHYPLKTPERSF